MDASNSKDSNITLLIEGEHQDGDIVDSIMGRVKLLKKVAFDSKVNNTIFYECLTVYVVTAKMNDVEISTYIVIR